MSDSQPNVLVIITDQQRADHVGFMGNDVVRTPNLDALAARGTVFENAWVSNPVCMPNRSDHDRPHADARTASSSTTGRSIGEPNTFVRQLRVSGAIAPR